MTHAASVSSSPKKNHLDILLKILGYLKSTIDREIVSRVIYLVSKAASVSSSPKKNHLDILLKILMMMAK